MKMKMMIKKFFILTRFFDRVTLDKSFTRISGLKVVIWSLDWTPKKIRHFFKNTTRMSKKHAKCGKEQLQPKKSVNTV